MIRDFRICIFRFVDAIKKIMIIELTKASLKERFDPEDFKGAEIYFRGKPVLGLKLNRAGFIDTSIVKGQRHQGHCVEDWIASQSVSGLPPIAIIQYLLEGEHPSSDLSVSSAEYKGTDLSL